MYCYFEWIEIGALYGNNQLTVIFWATIVPNKNNWSLQSWCHDYVDNYSKVSDKTFVMRRKTQLRSFKFWQYSSAYCKDEYYPLCQNCIKESELMEWTSSHSWYWYIRKHGIHSGKRCLWHWKSMFRQRKKICVKQPLKEMRQNSRKVIKIKWWKVMESI